MESKTTNTNEILEKISLQACMVETGDIPLMGEILNSLSDLEKSLTNGDRKDIPDLIHELQRYLEKLILHEKDDMEPFEKGVAALQSAVREIGMGKENLVDLKAVLEELGGNAEKAVAAQDKMSESVVTLKASPPVEIQGEDIQILNDFVTEAREHLETIEVNLVELENNPQDSEIINAIFRPFHTIKGVSGFLQLEKINILCHHTENLIDNVRAGQMEMDSRLSDIILESVDTVTLMIGKIEIDLISQKFPTFDDINIDPLLGRIQQVSGAAVSKKPLGRILVETGTIKEDDLRDALKKQKLQPEKRLGEILVEEKKTTPNGIASALNQQNNGKKTVKHQVKVDTDKLDNLVDLSGELVIAQSIFRQVGLEIASDNPKYFQQLNQVSQAVSTIQKIAMSMRMVQIQNIFQKMMRVVRDLARSTGKEVNLSMTGEETEIDRNMVEALYDPLVHMIRNSVDHGLETPDERERAGKPRAGNIYLRAYQKSGNIVIEIEDDGKGLDRDKILEKAVDRGLVPQGDAPSDKEIFGCILQPGFSTASTVTDVSGRGVGMDVVKKGIDKLSGRLDIASEPGKGTQFTVILPLTLAIIEGMLVRVGKERYILPAHAIVESFRPTPAECHTVSGKGEMVTARGSLIPLVRMESLFDITADARHPFEGIVVVAEYEGRQKGLLFDELLGKEEFVIKSMGETFKSVKGLAGAAILGDGKVGLILDMSGVFRIVEGR